MSRKYKILDPDGFYFVSFAVIHWMDVFTRREYNDILLESLEYCMKNKGLRVHAYVIMTSHVHLIISRRKSGRELAFILGDFKKFTSRKLIHAIENNPQESRREWMMRAFRSAGKQNPNNKEFQFWQQHNHPIELATTEMIEQRLEYIHQNPVAAGIVLRAEDYLYSSAADYAGEQGLLSIELL